MTVYGYLRVSTADGRQTNRSQRAALKNVGVTEFREERISGTKGVNQRPVLASLIDELEGPHYSVHVMEPPQGVMPQPVANMLQPRHSQNLF